MAKGLELDIFNTLSEPFYDILNTKTTEEL